MPLLPRAYAPNASASLAPSRIGETRIDSRSHSWIGVARKCGSFRQREPGRERDRNERVAEVVHADRLAAVSVQPCGITSHVDGPEHVAVRTQFLGEPRQYRHGRSGDERLERCTETVRLEFARPPPA